MAGAGVAAPVAAGVTFRTANAGETPDVSGPRTLSVAAAGKLASTLAEDLGADAAGTYCDAKGRSLVVNVLAEAAAGTIESAGAGARAVANPLAELKSARTALEQDAAVPGTSWVTDPTTDKVVATADRAVSEAEWATRAAARSASPPAAAATAPRAARPSSSR
ncbi:hypothetical protein DKG34_28650 [Streptomyces sp. NWU49]|nr:hypothetical protein DKG34_28650 [Streptomyces sp. NWU49]